MTKKLKSWESCVLFIFKTLFYYQFMPLLYFAFPSDEYGNKNSPYV